VDITDLVQALGRKATLRYAQDFSLDIAGDVI
jgi:hypothetical protein